MAATDPPSSFALPFHKGEREGVLRFAWLMEWCAPPVGLRDGDRRRVRGRGEGLASRWQEMTGVQACGWETVSSWRLTTLLQTHGQKQAFNGGQSRFCKLVRRNELPNGSL